MDYINSIQILFAYADQWNLGSDKLLSISY